MRISDGSSDVCSSDLGLRPVDALRFETEKVPKPTRRTSSPFLSAPEIESNTASTALLASPLPRPDASATAPISSCLLIPWEPPFDGQKRNRGLSRWRSKAIRPDRVKGKSREYGAGGPKFR